MGWAALWQYSCVCACAAAAHAPHSTPPLTRLPAPSSWLIITHPLSACRQMAAGDKLRVMYDGLSKDPNSLANLDQDLPNYAQVHSCGGGGV